MHIVAYRSSFDEVIHVRGKKKDNTARCWRKYILGLQQGPRPSSYDIKNKKYILGGWKVFVSFLNSSFYA